MKYKSEHYYRIGYAITGVVIIPFFILALETDKVIHNFLMLTTLIVGIEYSFSFPRQAMKLYEEILFKSFIESNSVIIQWFIVIIYSAVEIYYFITGKIILIGVFIIIYGIWNLVFKNQSVIIGEKNIIIGSKFISHDMVQAVFLEKNSVLIKTNKESFIIKNWALNKRRWKLERILNEITDI